MKIIITAWQIWKQRNGFIFENTLISFNRWKNNFKDESSSQNEGIPQNSFPLLGQLTCIAFLYS